MKYKIVYTDGARRDLHNIYGYISNTLLAPQTAAEQTQRIMKEIRLLDEMPMRHRLYNDELWHNQGLRFFSVDNYLVFYLFDGTTDTVKIVRIMYGGQDVRQQLTKVKNEY